MPNPTSETANPKAKMLWCVSLKQRLDFHSRGTGEVTGLTLETQYWVRGVVFNIVIDGVRADGYVIKNDKGEVRPYPCYLFQVLEIEQEIPSTTKNVWTADPQAVTVRCIDLQEHEMRPHGGWVLAKHLTLGREYRVVRVDQKTGDGVDNIVVIDDRGIETGFHCYMFEVVKTGR